MSNLASIQKLKYCGVNIGSCTCANVAIYQVDLISRKETSTNITTQYSDYRCEKHKLKGTTGKKIFKCNQLDQSLTLGVINRFLNSIIGKNISSSAHTAKELEVKYLKENGGVMCYQNYSKKWKFVYYNQIEAVMN